MEWLPITLVVGLVVALSGAVLYARKGQSLESTLGMPVFTFLAIVVYVSSLIGFFVTRFSTPTVDSWRTVWLIRSVWQVGGAVLVVAGLLVSAHAGGTLGKPAVWVLGLVFLATGPLMALNPLRDLLEGPSQLELTGGSVETWHRIRGGGGISAKVELRSPDGSPVDLSLVGWAVNDLQDRLADCAQGSTVHVTLLRHVERVIDVRCQPPPKNAPAGAAVR